MTRRLVRRLRQRARGFTLVELLVAIGILSMISVMIYGAFDQMRRSKQGIQRITDRYREGRLAMARISRDLQAAYLSAHTPIDQSIIVRQTAFIGQRGTPADRLDFNSFANRRLDRDSHESDQAEIGYFGSPDPDNRTTIDLARRISNRPDLDPQKGGRVEVLATNIDLFDLEYLDPLSGEWIETWDTTQAIGQANRMPLQVRVLLVLNDGARKDAGRGRGTIELTTKIPIHIQRPLTFATQ
jgi:general secretion pathway protein J